MIDLRSAGAGRAGARLAIVLALQSDAGMPNFKEQRYGLLTRISTRPPTGEVLYGKIDQGVHVHALPIRYDHDAWQAAFLANWPEDSPAWLSYYQRIMQGPNFALTA